MTRLTTLSTLCIECEGEILLPSDAEENEILVCPDCGIDLEVISLNPLSLAVAPMEAEDWGE